MIRLGIVALLGLAGLLADAQVADAARVVVRGGRRVVVVQRRAAVVVRRRAVVVAPRRAVVVRGRRAVVVRRGIFGGVRVRAPAVRIRVR